MPRETVSKIGSCCGRQPRPGEETVDVLEEATLNAFVAQHLADRITEIAELLNARELTQTAYYRRMIEQYTPSRALGFTEYRQKMAQEVRDHGFEKTGYPTFRRHFSGALTFVDGTFRLATMLALGRPAVAIVLPKA